MLKDAIRFSYINAKVRSLKSYLLDQSDYENLLKTKGYYGLTEYLKYTPYCKNINEGISSYDELIEIYYKNLFEDYVKLINSLSGHIKKLVYHLYQRYELENLKVILRTVCYNRPIEKTKNLLFPLVKYQTISIQEILTSKDPVDLILNLRGTWYHEPLMNSLYRFENEGETFPLEMALDLNYYKQLWEIVTSLSCKDQKIAKSILGVQLDALNILWIIRFKERYHLSPEEILNYSLFHGTYISKKVRKKLAYSVNQKDIVTNLEGTPYKRILSGINDPEISYVRLLQYTLLLVKKNWYKYPFQIGTILDYIFLKDMEIKDLITITEGKRMGIEDKIINEYLVHHLTLSC